MWVFLRTKGGLPNNRHGRLNVTEEPARAAGSALALFVIYHIEGRLKSMRRRTAIVSLAVALLGPTAVIFGAGSPPSQKAPQVRVFEGPN